MCGIGGIVSSDAPLGDEGRAALERIMAGLGHRGPDDRGTYVSRDGLAGLVHTRLAIIDLSPGGHQPMATEDGRY